MGRAGPKTLPRVGCVGPSGSHPRDCLLWVRGGPGGGEVGGEPEPHQGPGRRQAEDLEKALSL